MAEGTDRVMSDRSDGAGHGAGPTSGTVELDTLDVTLLALFAGWAAAEDVRQRLESRGFEGIRFGDGEKIVSMSIDPSITALSAISSACPARRGRARLS
jgi:hypothetical protein